MNRSTMLAVASVPAALGLAWHRHRRAVRSIEALPAVPPMLPGRIEEFGTPWGSASYRLVDGDPALPTVVMIHGWGRTGDTAWWPLVARCDLPMMIVDLPGHGRSRLEQPFTIELAAEALLAMVEHAGLDQPLLMAHSMGGPVALTAIRQAPGRFSGLLALATSSFWVTRRTRLMLALAPYAMATGSPLQVHIERSELERVPDRADTICWAYSTRPVGRLLHEGAAALGRFDAREWADLELPPTHWVVAMGDKVLDPADQYVSARRVDADVTWLDTRHSMVVEAPEALIRILHSHAMRTEIATAAIA